MEREIERDGKRERDSARERERERERDGGEANIRDLKISKSCL